MSLPYRGTLVSTYGTFHLMQGIASLRFLAGFCYTQLTDIEQEINGLLTYDRQPKALPQAIADINQELFKCLTQPY